MELKSKILELRAKGWSYRQIQKELGCSKSTICYYCKKGQKRKVVDRMTELRRDRKKYFVEYLGGKCCRCGYNKSMAALEFHHRDAKAKDFSPKIAITNNFETAKKEIDKCELVCSNCHREIHEKLDAI